MHRRFIAWVGGTVGGLAAYRLLRRRQTAPEPAPAEPDDRAEVLRAKLAETRAEEEQAAAEEEPPAEPTESAPSEALDERRRRVHEEGRATIDEMRRE